MLDGKRGVILGVSNKRSLGWAIARACVARGAQVALTYQNERLEAPVAKLVGKLAEETGSEPILLRCDVTEQEEIESLGAAVREQWGSLDFVVHSIAFANPVELRGRFRDATKAGFAQALDVSAYSLVPVSRVLAPLMKNGGSILTLSYLGGERVVPNYSLMGVAKAALDAAVRYLAYDLGPGGIRVNALAPGPVRTVSAASIGDFSRMLDHVEHVSPMRRNVTSEDVGNAAVFMVSDLSAGITGTHIPVDCGYSIMGATPPPREDEPEDGGEDEEGR